MSLKLPGDLQSERSRSNAFVAGQRVNTEGETEGCRPGQPGPSMEAGRLLTGRPAINRIRSWPG